VQDDDVDLACGVEEVAADVGRDVEVEGRRRRLRTAAEEPPRPRPPRVQVRRHLEHVGAAGALLADDHPRVVARISERRVEPSRSLRRAACAVAGREVEDPERPVAHAFTFDSCAPVE
jgi:hypothetical protein